MYVYRNHTVKAVDRFVQALTREAKTRGFLIHNEDRMEMTHIFGLQGVEVGEEFDLHIIQVCKPLKAAKSLSKNPERAVLMPHYIMTFSGDGATQIRFLHFSRDKVRQLVDDDEFPPALTDTFNDIIAMIEAAR